MNYSDVTKSIIYAFDKELSNKQGDFFIFCCIYQCYRTRPKCEEDFTEQHSAFHYIKLMRQNPTTQQ
jgi:hypothetical protein